MEDELKKEVIRLYSQGCSVRKVYELIKRSYSREGVRKELKKLGVLRGRGVVYKDLKSFTPKESQQFAEILGYFYGDGSLSLNKGKNLRQGLYKAYLTFALNEKDVVSRIVKITSDLFNFKPIVLKKESTYIINFRSTFAKYLSRIGYPHGKKSEINPHIPLKLLSTSGMKRSFVCGFLNAEASVHKTIAVQQSVRVSLDKEQIDLFKKENKSYFMKRQECYFIGWGKIRDKVVLKDFEQSNILLDLKSILDEFGIDSKVYPVRMYIGKNDKTSIHFELRITLKYIRLVKEAGMISCNKKIDHIYHLLQE